MPSNSANIKISDNIKYLYKMDKYLEKILLKPIKCSTVVNQVNSLSYSYILEYSDELWLYSLIWVNLTNIILRKRSKLPKNRNKLRKNTNTLKKKKTGEAKQYVIEACISMWQNLKNQGMIYYRSQNNCYSWMGEDMIVETVGTSHFLIFNLGIFIIL